MAQPHARFAGLLVACSACLTSMAAAQSTSVPPKTQQETMAERGYVRYRGAWRTAQEIELLERAERAHLARAEWKGRLERLRRQLDEPAQAERAAEEIAEIADPAAVPALGAAVATDRALQARVLVPRIRSAMRRRPSGPCQLAYRPAMFASSTWAVQMFEVAFSRRMCCSRV